MKLPIVSKPNTLRRKLFFSMCVLALLLCALFFAGLSILGSFTGTKAQLSDTLAFQAQLFEKQLDTYFDNLAVMSVQLSRSCSDLVEDYLSTHELRFSDINTSYEHIEALQERLIDPLRQKLWEADCTGVFVMLEAQVNADVENADTSRTGLYLERNSLERSDTRVLLYRGLAEVGKAHGCMPHRKWRLEFDTTLFPEHDARKSETAFPLNQSYRLSDVTLLPGTDQHVMLMTVPLLSQEGAYMGLCGFELSEGYFKQSFAQPSSLDHAIFCISKTNSTRALFEESTLSAGVLNAYYWKPSGHFIEQSFGNGLTEYKGSHESYIGITKSLPLCPGECNASISVWIPKTDYTRMLQDNLVRIVLLIFTFTVAAVGLAMFFTRQYIQPLVRALNSIRDRKYEKNEAYTAEINDLFHFLAEQDRINEEELSRLRREKEDAMTAAHILQSQFEETTKQNERLAYSRKDEIDPYDYENFKTGLATLTTKEKEVFGYYMEGKTVKEIMTTLGLQESTVRYHNKNIYSKLGVHSLKQLLRFAAILKQEDGNAL